jgi:hypothetical protein
MAFPDAKIYFLQRIERFDVQMVRCRYDIRRLPGPGQSAAIDGIEPRRLQMAAQALRLGDSFIIKRYIRRSLIA